MTIKRKKISTLVGIVVAGASRSQATDLYSTVALGNDSIGLSDSNGQSFVTHASAQDMFNPTNGRHDLKVEAGNFVAEASNADNDGKLVSVSYTICADGCNSHIISDHELEFCPSCSTALPELSDEEIESLSAEMDDQDFEQSDDHVMAVVADSQDEAVALFNEMFDGESVTYTSEAGTLVTHASVDVNFDPQLSIEDLEQVEDDEFSSLSSDDKPETAHVFECAGECGCFTVTSSDQSVICMNCGGGLIEPSLSASIEELEEELFSLSSDDEEEDEEEDDYDMEEDEEEDEDEEDFDIGDDEEDEDEDDFASESSDDDLDEDLDDDIDEDDDMEDLEDMDDEDEDDFASESSDDMDEFDEDEDEDDDIEGFDLEDDEDEDDEDMSSESMVYDDIEVDLLTSISASGDLDASKLSVVASGRLEGESTWTAFYGRIPVAMASESSVARTPSLVDVFHKPSFGAAVAAAAKIDGIDQALSDFNFDRINPDINIDHVVDYAIMQKAEARVTEVQESFELERSQQQQRLEAALATSALGINRNVFNGVTNPIANRLITALSAAGVGNANELVADAFAQSSDKYNELLVGQAMSLLSKPVESQNEIANMVANASHSNYVSTSNSVTDRLADWPERTIAPAETTQENLGMQSQSSSASKSRAERWNIIRKN